VQVGLAVTGALGKQTEADPLARASVRGRRDLLAISTYAIVLYLSPRRLASPSWVHQ
jgi:hypothetical protein